MAMAIVQGIREKVHLPIYDSLTVEPGKQLRDKEPSSTLRFFVNVQNKTKLETNLQSASLLPHYNTFEARAMRVVISDLPPEFPEELEKTIKDLPVTNPNGKRIDSEGKVESVDTGESGFDATKVVTAEFKVSLADLLRYLKEAKDADDGIAVIDLDKEGVELFAANNSTPLTDKAPVRTADGGVDLSVDDIEDALEKVFERKSPPKEQIHPNDGCGTLIGKFIYNTVTTLYVGEKIMIQMPTWFFPAGAGPYSEAGKVTTHGEPSPTSTFRFAEAIHIDRQQNFRVEIEVPDADVLKEMQQIYGPLFIWVVLDGYMTRGVH